VIAQDNGIMHGSRLMIGEELFIRDALISSRSSSGSGRSVAVRSHEEQHKPSVIPARAFAYVLADEVNPFTRKVVRKVMTNPQMAAELAQRIGRPAQLFPNPSKYGLHSANPLSPISLGRHAMGMDGSAFMSASDHALGASRIAGSRFWIDVEAAQRAGLSFHETEEILRDLDRIERKLGKRADLARLRKYRALIARDAEVAFRGSTIPPSAIKGAAAMGMTRALQGVQIVGFIVTAVELGDAAERSIATHSVLPLTAESIRQGGSWASAWAGMKLGGSAGAAVGIETGPGAIVTGLIGAVFGGAAGYFAFDWAADHLDRN
jgi:hypothetical protein